MARGRATDTDKLVRAAADVFRLKGYRNSTIDDIAEAAGISKPTVYKYAKSKQHLLDLMVDEITRSFGEGLEAALSADASARDRLRRYVSFQVAAMAANKYFYAIVFAEEIELSEASRQTFRSWARDVTVDFRGLVADCLAENKRRSKSSLDPVVAANLVLSMLTSIYRWYDVEGPMDEPELTRQILLLLEPALT